MTEPDAIIEHEVSILPPPLGPVFFAVPPFDKLPISTSARRVINALRAKIDVLHSTTITRLTRIVHTNSTLVMNYISSASVCIAYPWSFHDKAGIISLSPRYDPAYRSRHF